MSHNYESLRRNRKNTEAANEKKRSPAGYRKPIYSGFFFKGGLASIL